MVPMKAVEILKPSDTAIIAGELMIAARKASRENVHQVVGVLMPCPTSEKL